MYSFIGKVVVGVLAIGIGSTVVNKIRECSKKSCECKAFDIEGLKALVQESPALVGLEEITEHGLDTLVCKYSIWAVGLVTENSNANVGPVAFLAEYDKKEK